MRFNKLCLIIFIFILAPVSALAIEGKFSGNLFGDYYWMIQNNNAALNDQNGFWLRRVYLTYDAQIVNTVDTRVRLELASPGDFKSATVITPFLKDAYLKWKPCPHAITLGLFSNPALDAMESVWGYRFVEKVSTDLAQMESSRDLGVGVSGPILKNETLKYQVMVGNGSGTKGEINAQKKGYFGLTYAPTQTLTFQGYADYEAGLGNTDAYTLHGFAGYTPKWARLGLLFAYQNTNPATTLRLLSGFVVVPLTNILHAIARVDRLFDPNPKGATNPYLPFNTTASSWFGLVGVDCEPWANVHFVPNVETIMYEGGTSPISDWMARLTFSYQF